MLLVTSPDKNSKVDINKFLRHEREPDEFANYRPSPEDQIELLASRHFLKRRVWRNMSKIRRHNTQLKHSSKEPKKRFYRVGHQRLPA